MKMSLVKACTIIDIVPEDLSALLITKFQTDGPTVSLCAVGDIGLSGRVRVSMNSLEGCDGLLAEVAPALKKADITFGNLETPLTEEIAREQLFSAPVVGAGMLERSGFKLIHLAN